MLDVMEAVKNVSDVNSVPQSWQLCNFSDHAGFAHAWHCFAVKCSHQVQDVYQDRSEYSVTCMTCIDNTPYSKLQDNPKPYKKCQLDLCAT